MILWHMGAYIGNSGAEYSRISGSASWECVPLFGDNYQSTMWMKVKYELECVNILKQIWEVGKTALVPSFTTFSLPLTLSAFSILSSVEVVLNGRVGWREAVAGFDRQVGNSLEPCRTTLRVHVFKEPLYITSGQAASSNHYHEPPILDSLFLAFLYFCLQT